MSLSFSEAVKHLATYRVRNTRSSEEIVQLGTKIIRENGLNKMGDECACNIRATLLSTDTRHVSAWAFLEQVALAALDIGQLKLAYVCEPR